MTAINKCCPQCRHGHDTPCPDAVRCWTEGPLCHDSEDCRAAIRERVARDSRSRVDRPVIMLGTGTCGLGAGAAETLEAVREYLRKTGLAADIKEVGCIGLCALEPMMDVRMPGRARVSFHSVTGDKVEKILDAFFAGQIDKDHALCQFGGEGLESYDGVTGIENHPFFAPQLRWVLANCGHIDPKRIDEYVARGGYRGLAGVLRGKTPVEVCDVLEKSGLRGRGGGGFLAGKKWRMANQTPGEQKYLICNADEGDPGAFMDRAVIEGDPHRLIEGMAIAAYAIGASKAYIYIRAEYPLAIDRLVTAIAEARSLGLVGFNILDSGFNLDFIIKKGAGAFVCGEETALIHSIEGKRGMPRPRPPYPSTKGLFGKPTAISNVETLANVPEIMVRGADWFSSVGTEGSKGTKIFALSGKVRNTGLVEVPMGTTIRQIVFDIGGGIDQGRKYKAVQIGGPSGGCIPEAHIDTQIDYESLKAIGAIMGSGGLVVMDDANCMVDIAKYFMSFIQRESCGKCIPCREGTKRLLEILERITRRRSSETEIETLERFQGVVWMNRLAKVIKETSLCGLGQTAPNPVLSTLRWFREEYEAHVYDRRCPAGVCKDLLEFKIDTDKCKGCTLCLKKCPTGAVMGAPKSPHYIVMDKCIGCGTCRDVCRFGAVLVE